MGGLIPCQRSPSPTLSRLGPPGHSPVRTISSEGSCPTNSSPRASRAPKSRLHACTASWISSWSSDCGEMPVFAGYPCSVRNCQELWPLLPFPTRTSAPSPSTPDPCVTLPSHLCQSSPSPAPGPSNLEPCEAGENVQYSPGLHLTIICPFLEFLISFLLPPSSPQFCLRHIPHCLALLEPQASNAAGRCAVSSSRIC